MFNWVNTVLKPNGRVDIERGDKGPQYSNIFVKHKIEDAQSSKYAIEKIEKVNIERNDEGAHRDPLLPLS